MPHLEFTKANCNFEKMKDMSPEFSKEEWFPQDVQIIENEQTDNVKEVSFNM